MPINCCIWYYCNIQLGVVVFCPKKLRICKYFTYFVYNIFIENVAHCKASLKALLQISKESNTKIHVTKNIYVCINSKCIHVYRRN